jgi:DNA helicase-2/ATP-dependent DNA helicase PcrA
VRFTAHDDDEAEAAAVAARIARLVADGTRAGDVAVLYRTNVQGEAYEEALAAVGIGYQVRGSERFFARRDVRDALVLLRGGARAADPDTPMPQVVRDLLASVGWAEQPPAARGAARERWDAMNALVTLADELAAAGASRVGDLVAELDERAAAQHAPAVDGVTLASLHAAKGLEWDTVFLVGLSEGLLHVGVTRARRRLELSYARARTPGSRATRARSRFLDEVWPAAGSSGIRSGADGEDPDEALLVRLRTWRARVAQAAGRPTYAVLGDHALEQVARSRPTTTAELARVRGVGALTIERHGAALLALVAGLEPPPR